MYITPCSLLSAGNLGLGFYFSGQMHESREVEERKDKQSEQGRTYLTSSLLPLQNLPNPPPLLPTISPSRPSRSIVRRRTSTSLNIITHPHRNRRLLKRRAPCAIKSIAVLPRLISTTPAPHGRRIDHPGRRVLMQMCRTENGALCDRECGQLTMSHWEFCSTTTGADDEADDEEGDDDGGGGG